MKSNNGFKGFNGFNVAELIFEKGESMEFYFEHNLGKQVVVHSFFDLTKLFWRLCDNFNDFPSL